MSNPPAGQKKTDIREKFQQQMDRLIFTAEKEEKALEQEDAPDWYMPEPFDWNGDLFNIEGIAEPFLRDDHYQDFKDVCKNAEDPGTVGDLAAIQLQGDWLACLERAFRARYKSHCRAMVQASGRRMGHHKKIFEKSLKGYIERILQQAAGGS